MSATSPARVAHLLRTEQRRTRSPGQILYGLYLVLLFGGLYGGLLVHAIVTIATPPATSEQLLLLGTVTVALPPVVAVVGLRFGRWAGPVPVTRPEAAILLPTPLDRRRLLLPRFAWSLGVTVVAGALLALVGVVLLALAVTVGPAAWWLLPTLGAVLGLLATGCAGVAQSWPLGARWHAVAAFVLLGLLVPVVLVGRGTWLGQPPSESAAVHLAAGLLGLGAVAPPGFLLGGLAAAAVVIALVAGRAVWRCHDEELAARAGIHGGAVASLRMGDLRAVTQMATGPRPRQRAVPALPLPRRSTGVVTWRHLLTLRAQPGPLVRATLGWAVAVWLLTATPEQTSLSGSSFRVIAASGVLLIAVAPLLEPLRREHDAPLAAELLPFGFAELARLHLRAATLLTTLTGVLGVLLSSLVLEGVPLGWSLVVVPMAAVTAVVTVADRVRQPQNLAEVVAAMPMGATPEVLGVALAARVATPLLGMLPAAVPLWAALAAPLLPVPGTVALVVAVLGVALLGLRVGGLLLWLREFEVSLLDAEVLEPSSTVPIAWRRLRAWWARRR